MKTIKLSFGRVLVISILLLFACKKKDVVRSIALTAAVAYDASESALNLPKEGIQVKVTNLTNGQSYNATTDAEGKVMFESMAPGSYSITADRVFTPEQYQAATGISVAQPVSFNAASTETFTVDSKVQLVLAAGKIGDLVFKQIYYAGSNTSRGVSFRDQFIEIYNNSNKVIYADSLYFGNGYANMTPLTSAPAYDWTAAEGMPAGINANDKFIYARFLFMIPGNGKQYPIEPGKSMIIACTALDHTQSFTGNDGKTYSVTDPSLTVNLSNADFETYLVDYWREQSTDPANYKPYMWDVDNPSVTNAQVLWVVTGKEYLLDPLGRDDFFIFKTSESIDTWQNYPKPGESASAGKLYKQIPIKHIIDAVEVTQAVENRRSAKRIPVVLDGAPAFVTGGQYSSQSIVRKTLKIVNGRRILQDTNNSANDFFTKSKADPSKSESSFLEN